MTIEGTKQSKGRFPRIDYENNVNDIHNFKLKKINKNERCWEIDRERIIYSTAFRRLQGKTQIYLATFGDHYSDRLTHTLFVCEIAKQISRELSSYTNNEVILNESLIEAISLAHDLGHTPFGHEGEKTLNKLMRKEGGFSHNLQGANVVNYIEYDKIWSKNRVGLGLTLEVVLGIVKHTNKELKCLEDKIKIEGIDINSEKFETPESKVVFYADEIAQRVFDIEDAIRSKLLNVNDLKFKNLIKKHNISSTNFKSVLVKKYIKDICESKLLGLKFKSIYCKPFIQMKGLDDDLDEIITDIHNNDIVKIMDKRGCHIIETLFNRYLEHWEKFESCTKENGNCKCDYLPPVSIRENEKLFNLSKERIIANYIASMTDSFAEKEYFRLFI